MVKAGKRIMVLNRVVPKTAGGTTYVIDVRGVPTSVALAEYRALEILQSVSPTFNVVLVTDSSEFSAARRMRWTVESFIPHDLAVVLLGREPAEEYQRARLRFVMDTYAHATYLGPALGGPAAMRVYQIIARSEGVSYAPLLNSLNAAYDEELTSSGGFPRSARPDAITTVTSPQSAQVVVVVEAVQGTVSSSDIELPRGSGHQVLVLLVLYDPAMDRRAAYDVHARAMSVEGDKPLLRIFSKEVDDLMGLSTEQSFRALSFDTDEGPRINELISMGLNRLAAEILLGD